VPPPPPPLGAQRQRATSQASAKCAPRRPSPPCAPLDLAELKKGWHKEQAKLGWSLSPEGEVVVTKTSGDDAVVPAGALGKHPLF
jgi:hypothetical protein